MAVARSPTCRVIPFSAYHVWAGQLQVLGVALFEVLGQVDAIVGRPRLFAERHDLEIAVGVVGRQPLAEPVADHAVADDHHGLPLGCVRDHRRVLVLAVDEWWARRGRSRFHPSRAARTRAAQAL